MPSDELDHDPLDPNESPNQAEWTPTTPVTWTRAINHVQDQLAATTATVAQTLGGGGITTPYAITMNQITAGTITTTGATGGMGAMGHTAVNGTAYYFPTYGAVTLATPTPVRGPVARWVDTAKSWFRLLVRGPLEFLRTLGSRRSSTNSSHEPRYLLVKSRTSNTSRRESIYNYALMSNTMAILQAGDSIRTEDDVFCLLNAEQLRTPVGRPARLYDIETAQYV